MTSKRKLWLLFAILLMTFLLSAMLGRFPAPGFQSIHSLIEKPLARSILINVRLPRVLFGMLLGISLSVAGLVFQTVFSNPMVEPGFLGVSQGASFGAALGIVFFNGGQSLVQITAIFFGFAGLLLSVFLARSLRFGSWVLRIVLSGIMVSSFFSAALGLIKYAADIDDRLFQLSFWLLGGTNSAAWDNLRFIIPFILAGLWLIYSLRWRLNLLSLEDETAVSLGFNQKALRAIFLFCGVLLTSLCISISGIVGWVGLIIPHIARKLFGANTEYTVPASIFLGGIFMLICDDLARTLFIIEIPLGVITSLTGAIFFIGLMRKMN